MISSVKMELHHRWPKLHRAKERAGRNLDLSWEESDSEDGDEQPGAVIAIKPDPDESMAAVQPSAQDAVQDRVVEVVTAERDKDDALPTDEAIRPPLIKEETSYGPGLDEFKDFEGMDDFDEDLYEGGDEFLERQYMEEQARLEEDDDEKDYDPSPPEQESLVKQESASGPGEGAPICPMCSISLAGVSEQDAGVHVNNCLDGNSNATSREKTNASKANMEH